MENEQSPLLKHTPLPWEFDSSDMNVYNPAGVSIATVHRRAKVVGVDDIEKAGFSIETKANAVLIIEACNNYYQLKEALTKAKDFIEAIDDDGEGKADWKILHEIDSALNPQKA